MTKPSPDSAPEMVARDGARCAVYRDAPKWQGHRTAAIGQFSCEQPASGRALLEQVCAALAAEGFAAVIGPMDGDTWHKYRVVTESDGSKPFPLEPVSGPEDHAAFVAAGFAPISEYVSARAIIPANEDEPPFEVPGLSIETWDGGDAAALIGRVFDLSLGAFARNAFYKPITREAFLELYRPVIPAIDKRFVLFARVASGDIAGFLFAYPNVFEGPSPRTLVIKTYASAVKGGGRAMLDAVHHNARRFGFTHAIHALMHVDNVSRDRSQRHGGEIFRRYALMGRML